jgi:hypothetical protein
MTNVEGIFACGNVLHIHDLVDHVSMEGQWVAKSILTHLNRQVHQKSIPITFSGALSYVLPQTYTSESPSLVLKYRVNKPLHKGVLRIISNDTVLLKVLKNDLHPSEMQTLTLSSALLDKINYNLSVELSDE